MSMELRIVGPGLDDRRVIADGQPELVLGRDVECHVRLPDPQRNVSRRHLAVWSEAGELHFRVLSVVNGVEMPFGEAPPGAHGVLPLGQTAKVGEYTLIAEALVPAPAPKASEPEDPWAVFDRDGSGIAPAPPALRASLASAQTQGATAPADADEDPFGDWGFETTFGPGSRAGPLQATTAGAAAPDVSAFFSGLGLDPGQLGPLSPGELEAIGKVVRAALEGLFEMHAARTELKKDLRAEDRTMVAVKDNNPLKADWPLETRLRYLFGGRASSVGFGNPERALRDLLAELLAHDNAMGVASRAVVQGTLRELSPAALKTHLLGSGAKLFEASRLWDAYTKHHAQQGERMDDWIQRLFDKHFTEAYLRETARIKRETSTRPN